MLLGLIFLTLGVISTNADGSWIRYGNDNIEDIKDINWKIDEKEIKGDDGDKKDDKKEDYEWGGSGYYGDDKFHNGVAIGYGNVIDGKKLRVNEEEVTNEENHVRPCSFDDWECIRKFFAYNSDCNPAYGPIPDPLYLKQNTLFFPLANLTFTLTDLKVRGMSSAKISEFYYNKKTGDLVFAIAVTNLNQTTPKAYLSYRRPGKESIVKADFATILFKSLVFTAIIPKVPKLRLDQAEVHVAVGERTPTFYVGPKAFTSKVPDVIKAYAEFVTFFPISVREGTFFQASLLTSLFIQKNVCDFGVKLYSV